MTPAKFQSLFNGQTSIARKVYEAVPMQEHWSSARIHQELIRIGAGGGRDIRITAGCLKALKESGLLREPATGEYVRIEVRAKPDSAPDIDDEQEPLYYHTTKDEAVQKTQPTQPAQKSTTQQENSPIEILAKLATRGAELAVMVKAFSADIEAAAITIEDRIAQDSADIAKLKQFKQLFNSLGA